ncbi:MAG: transglutaminase domain-containing protein [Caldisericia bacterium]
MKRARAVYDWVVSNIEYDLVSIYHDDITCGNYQTTYGGFGIDFDDWCYTPEEVIENGRAICIEFERLTTALLRYLEVPARSAPLKAHPVTQFWVQESANSDGYWANMETSKGRTEWKKGNLDAGFPSREDSKVAIIPQDENAPIHMKWDFGAECLWLEDYGGSFLLEGTWDDNQEEWLKQLDTFSKIGSLPKQGNPGSRPADAHMNGSDGGVNSIYYRGFEVELANATETHPVVKFPFFVENEWRKQYEMSHYVSIPEIVEDVWVETDENEESGLTQKWYCIRLDLTKITPHESDDSTNLLKNPGFEEGEIGWNPRKVGRDTAGNSLEIVELSRSGECSAKITNESDGVSIWVQIVTDIESPAFVKLSGYIKSEGSKGRAFIDLNCLGGEKENKPPYPATEPAVTGTSDWTYVEGIFEVTEGSDAVAIGCTLLGTGTVWFDDISLTIIGGETKSTSMIEEWVNNPSSGTDLCVHIIKPSTDKPESGYPSVLVVPGGNGFGTQMEDSRLVSDIVKSGVVVVVFDPEGRGKTGGTDNFSGLIHQDGMHEVLSYVSELPFVDPENLGVLSMSFGLIMSACTLGRYPNDPPVKFFIDKEGPDGSLCDYSGKHGQSLPKDEDYWEEREAYLEIENYPGNYLRIQNEKDHVQKTKDHALRTINHATSTEYGGFGSCKFTRVNFAEGEFSNPANTTYTVENPPVWIDNKKVERNQSDKMVVDFILR